MQNKKICQDRDVIAAFDFDGTISTRDSLPYFLKFTTGSFKTFYKLFTHIPMFIAFYLKQVSRQQVKESLIKSFFKGMPIDDLRQEGEKFAKGPLLKILKSKALDKINWHLKCGHKCVLVSANLDVYLDAFAKNHGFYASLASRVDFDDKGLVTGYLKGDNCREVEKVRRLQELFGKEKNYVLYAYGDSDGDKALLDYADYPFYREF